MLVAPLSENRVWEALFDPCSSQFATQRLPLTSTEFKPCFQDVHIDTIANDISIAGSFVNVLDCNVWLQFYKLGLQIVQAKTCQW